MRRLLGLIALAAALALAVVAPIGASDQHPTLGELETEVMCPTCKTTLDQSNAPVATRIRQFITTRIEAGDTKAEIKRRLVAEFGPEILAEPSKRGFNLLAWVLPLVGIVLAAVVLGWLAWKWSRGRSTAGEADGTGDSGGPAGSQSLDPELERRVDEELARFEA